MRPESKLVAPFLIGCHAMHDAYSIIIFIRYKLVVCPCLKNNRAVKLKFSESDPHSVGSYVVSE
jgi:hypothetical protein